MLDMDAPSMFPGKDTFFRPIAIRLVFSALGMGACAAEVRAEPAQPQPGRWLLDYALTYAGALQKPTEADAEFTLIWLDAAGRVSPDLDEAFLWQFDLFSRLGRPQQALEALGIYCKANPRDVSAALNRVSLIVEKAQTTEERIAACESLLAETPARGEVASDLHRRIAELLFAQGETARALEHVKRALTLYPHNLAARALDARIEERHDQPGVMVELLLRELAARPTSPDVMRRLAETLGRYGSSDMAIEWLHAALESCRANPGSCHSEPIRLDLARTYLDLGRFDDCISQCDAILAERPDEFEAQLLRIEASRRLGRDEAADDFIEKLSQRFVELESAAIEQRDARTCAWIAWFHIEVMAVPERALRFAGLANEFAPRTPQIQRVLGWAQLAMDQFEKAMATLVPLAKDDPWAAVGLARARQNSGDPEAAADALRIAHGLRPVGVVRDRMMETARKLDLHLSPYPPDPAVTAAMQNFDRRILDVAAHPAGALEFGVTMSAHSIEVAQSVAATISLTNRGPVMISLGEGGVVDPRVAVSVRDTALKGVRLDAYEFLTLHGSFALEPGERLEVTRILDVGPARRLLRRDAQRRFDLQFSFVLSPRMEADGRVASALSGISPVSRIVTRLPVDASDKGLQTIEKLLQSGSESERAQAVATVIALLEERHDTLTERATYPAIRINQARVAGMLVGALNDATPLVRTRALFGFLRLRPTDDMIASAAPMISDENWLARLVAVEVFSRLQRSRFLPVLTDLAGDPHPLVSQLAELHRKRFSLSGASTPRR